MATTMKKSATTSTQKKATRAATPKVEKTDEVATASSVEVEETVKETVETKTPRKFVPGDMIECRCVRPNKTVFYSTKTDTRYEFGGFGDINEVDYSDLLKLKSSKSPILFAPKILIEDEELREQWARDLESISADYDGIYNTEELFDMSPDEFETFVRNASDGVKDVIKLSASNLIKEEKLTDLRIIRIIDDIFGTQYKDFI